MNFSRSIECGIMKIPQAFLFFLEDRLWVFRVYGSVFTNPFFSLWVHMRKRAGIVKGLQVP